MFHRRLTWFWALLCAATVLIVVRLLHIQVVQAAHYEQLAQRILTRPHRYLAAPRGSILDHHGRTLVSDQPCFTITMHYGVLAGRSEYLTGAARALRRRGYYPAETPLTEIVARLTQVEIPRTWRRLSELTGLSVAELHQRAAEVCARVDRIRAAVLRRSPGIRQIAEEDQLMPVLENVDSAVALPVRLELEEYPWLRVIPATRRVAHEADALVHVLGRLGAAGPAQIEADPYRTDELRRLRPQDLCGISGVEYLAEASLRGRRGRIVEEYDRQVRERLDPVAGQDVQLTIDLDLQHRVLELLEQAVRGSQYPAGGAAVVIDVATREVRALVSYPTYSYENYPAEYDRLARDAERLPLLFRAVQAEYPPGSICKAITLVGGLSDGVITPQTKIHCTGHLLPDDPNRFRCWIYNLSPGLTHDAVDDPEGQDGVRAVRNSCNIYFYKVGQKLGAERLCQWFARFGLGRSCGTGLIEEACGTVPTEEWLMRNAGRGHQAADAWNYAIGQGEVTVTPLQAANVAATIASGVWEPVRLAYDQTGHVFGTGPASVTSFDEESLGVLRRGMWAAVNEPGGTGRHARLDLEGYELCGKTGSAQTVPRPTAYRYVFEWPDGRRQEAVAYLEADAAAQFADPPVRCVGKHAVRRYPQLEEGERLPTHAWFIGYTQPAATPRGQRPAGPVYAISVIVEFAGGGGSVAAPVAKAIAEYLLGPAVIK